MCVENERWERIKRALEKCFLIGEDGFYRVGDHILLQSKPSMDELTDILIEIPRLKMTASVIKKIIKQQTWGQLTHKAGYVDVFFIDDIINTGIQYKHWMKTRNSFANKLTNEFVENMINEKVQACNGKS